MAIAGAGIRQSREIRARADSRLHPRKSGTEQRRRVFFDIRHDAIADNVLPPERPPTWDEPLVTLSETRRSGAVPFARSARHDVSAPEWDPRQGPA